MTSSSWKLRASDVKKLPTSNYKSLTQIYNDRSLTNREVTYRDERLLTSRGIHTTYNEFLPYRTVKEWEKRKKYLRQQILVSAGLWPVLRKTPLHPKYHQKIEQADYTLETVTIEPYPGFRLGGNLYRPKGTGPFPAVLCSHGHFTHGRLTNNVITSVPGRCINFARQGYVAFAYDMAGYNDTKQIPHNFASDELSALYGINLLGLQLWDSVRALDFVLSLPEIDKSRVGITGASGGGTQAFLLAAIDDRIQAAAPVNMVSNLMQGGDLCENAPGLRINTFNVEIAAMIAPKPLLLVSSTRDWTHNTRNTIMPMLQTVYELYGAKDKLTNKHFDWPHNYNKASREAVYHWFGKWFLHENDPEKLNEKPFKVGRSKGMLAFLNKKTANRISTFETLSAGEYHGTPAPLNADGLKSLLKDSFTNQLARYWPKDRDSLKRFKQIYSAAIQQLTGAKVPDAVTSEIMDKSKGSNFVATQLLISIKDKNGWIPCVLYQPLSTQKRTVILTSDAGKSNGIRKGSCTPDIGVSGLLASGCNVLVPDLFKQGEHVLQTSTMTRKKEHDPYFTTYNLTDRQEQIQDILTIIAAVKENTGLSGKIELWASGNTGMTALLLAPQKNFLHKIAIDGGQFNPATDRNMLKLQIPGIMRIGGLKTILAVTLIKGANILLYNAHPKLVDPDVTEVSKYANVDPSSFVVTQKLVTFGDIAAFFKS